MKRSAGFSVAEEFDGVLEWCSWVCLRGSPPGQVRGRRRGKKAWSAMAAWSMARRCSADAACKSSMGFLWGDVGGDEEDAVGVEDFAGALAGDEVAVVDGVEGSAV